MDIRKVFGTNVRRHRLALELSQEALAERMGVDRAYVSGIERGRQNATIISVWQTALALDVRPMDLLDADGASEVPKQRRSPKPTRRGARRA